MDTNHRASQTLQLRPADPTITAIGDTCCSLAGASTASAEADTCCSAPPLTVTAEHDGCCSSTAARTDARWLAAARYARVLAWLSLAWMTLEGVLGLVAGIHDASIALVAWALGSAIEGLASVFVIWRFTGNRTLSEDAERRAQRMVAVSFFLLTPYVAAEAIHDLAVGHQAHPGLVGIVLTASSVLLMPLLGVTKRRLGSRLGSGATAGEGTQNLMCAAQGAAVLVGLAVTTALGWHWVDPAVALALAAWAVLEGVRAWRGEDCC
jgi:divalent metal cation (Fe/Co/Zn/Cd) transporter